MPRNRANLISRVSLALQVPSAENFDICTNLFAAASQPVYIIEKRLENIISLHLMFFCRFYRYFGIVLLTNTWLNTCIYDKIILNELLLPQATSVDRNGLFGSDKDQEMSRFLQHRPCPATNWSTSTDRSFVKCSSIFPHHSETHLPVRVATATA
jgi:hypothetical protein